MFNWGGDAVLRRSELCAAAEQCVPGDVTKPSLRRTQAKDSGLRSLHRQVWAVAREGSRVAGTSRARAGQWLKSHSCRGLRGIRKNLETMTRDGEAVVPSQGGDTRTSNVAGALVPQVGRPPSREGLRDSSPSIRKIQPVEHFSVLHFIFIFTTAL